MPMNRALYPANWDTIASYVKRIANWKCAECGMQCRRPGEKFDTHKRTLTVAHLDHNPANSRLKNLRALCSGCHLRYDAPEKARRRRERAKFGCQRCEKLDAVRAWSEDKLRRLLKLSGALDSYDRATIRAIAEALGDGNPRIQKQKQKQI